MSDPFIGEIIMFGGNFAPRSWAFCDGQLLPISQNTALFSILGTIYGGDGRTTFGLPEMRGRVAIHPGIGPGLSSYRLGQRGGLETVTLTANQMPSHTHTATLNAEVTPPTQANPSGAMLAGASIYGPSAPSPNRALSADAVQVQNTGGSQAHTNIQPYLCVNYIIALQGVFPSRN